MLSLRDLLDYCDITDDQVALFAEHEGITDAAAAHTVCGLVQTPEGVTLLTGYMLDLVDRAERGGDKKRAARARRVCARFMADHPLPAPFH